MVDPSYSPYFKSRIPFLNGGLFEPKYDWENSFMYIDDKIFEKILDVFDLYNFTVKEDEPLEKEVAVDPEMLGKVFENLLEENLRKGKGTYYTPREIVHYMCQESLINYLITESKIDEKRIRKLIYRDMVITKEDLTRTKENKNNRSLKNKPLVLWEGEAKQLEKILKDIKVVDPACGSGAFLVSMLQEIVRARQLLQLFTDEKKIDEYKLKKETIQNCIYGVDIDPGAIEIAKLRLWLSLIVDYEVEEIEPLPNLDYKIMQGNSLIEDLVLGDINIKLFDIGVIKGQQIKKNFFDRKIQEDLFGDLEARRKIIEKLNNLHKEYFEISDLEEKKKKRGEIDRIEQNLIEKCVKKEIERLENESKNIGNYIIPGVGMKEEDAHKLSKNISEQTQIMSIFNEFKNSGVKPFFLWKLYFADVFEKKNGFDIVIANPPYIKEYTDRKAFDGLRKSPYYQGKMDLWYFFGSISLDLLHKDGVECFIATNNWVSNAGASKFRNKIVGESKIAEFIDFGNCKVFETADIQTMVFLLKKNKEDQIYTVKYSKLLDNKVSKTFLDIFLNTERQDNKFVKYNVSFNRSDFRDRFISFLEPEISNILDKISSQDVIYLKDDEVAQGIVCPQETLNKKNAEELDKKYKVGHGIFVLSEKEVDALKLINNEYEIIKPFYTTSELKRYYGSNKNKYWIIYAQSDMNYRINKYPNIKRHLDQFKTINTSAFRPYGLHRARDEKFFKGEKIVSLRKCKSPTFTYVSFNCYVSQTFFIIKTRHIDIKYLISLLNSKLIEFWLFYKGKKQGNIYQIDKEPLTNIPIKKATVQGQKLFINLVNEIFAITKSEDYSEDSLKKNKVKKYENQIDQLIYKLYELTDDEIEIVENFNKKA